MIHELRSQFSMTEFGESQLTRLNNLVLVRLEVAGKKSTRFEVDCYKDKALEWKKNLEHMRRTGYASDPHQVCITGKIYSDFKNEKVSS